MYNHKLVPDGVTVSNPYKEHGKKYDEGFSDGVAIMIGKSIPCPSEWTAEEAVEILKITKSELDSIGLWLYWDSRRKLSSLIFDLISLAPLKGLTVEEIQELAKLTP